MLELAAGLHAADGTIRYADGPAAGDGVPGQLIFAEGDEDDRFSVAFSEIDGSYSLTLTDGDWFVLPENEFQLALAGAVEGEMSGQPVSVAGAPTMVADVQVPAINAVIRGVLRDDVGTPRGGQRVEAETDFFCFPDCYEARAVTAGDGSFVLGVRAAIGPDTTDWFLEPTVPLSGMIAPIPRVTLSAGDDLGGQDLDHIAPTNFIHGTFETIAGDPVSDLCVWADSFGPTSYVSRGRAGCDGSYSLPVIDGDWEVEFGEEGPAEFFRDVDVSGFFESVTIAGEDERLNILLGPSVTGPAIRLLEPSAARVGDHVVIEGVNFALEGLPEVRFDGIPATLVGFRPDIGRLVAEVPGSLKGDRPQITVHDPFSGRGSEPACFELLGGSFAPACTISGTLTRNGGAALVEGGLVVAFDLDTERFIRSAVSDASGAYSLDLPDDSTSYQLLMIPSSSTARVWGGYDSVACPAVQDHNFRTGRLINGRVVQEGERVPGVVVSAEGDLAFAEAVTRDNGTFSMRLEEGDDVEFEFTAPPGSRFINDQFVQMTISGSTTLPDVELSRGGIFAGTIDAASDDLLAARIRGSLKNGGGPSGSAVSSSCDGSFGIALAVEDHRLEIRPQAGDNDTDVDSVEFDGDERAEFAFPVFPGGPLGFDDGLPRITTEVDNFGQVGQGIFLQVENLGDGTSVFFVSDPAKHERAPQKGIGPAGLDTVTDTARGLLLTRVPAGAHRSMVVFTDSELTPPVPFLVEPGLWDPGMLTVSGAVFQQGMAVEGAIVLLLREEEQAEDCFGEPDFELHDYAATDAAGQYALTHPGGDIFLLVLPPRDALPDDLAPAVLELADVMTDFTGVDFDLLPGSALTLRVVAGDPAMPVPGALVFADGDVFDMGITDDNGQITLYLPPGDGELEIDGPVGSRLQPLELAATAPVDLGDVPLISGPTVAGRVVDINDDPIGVADVDGHPLSGGFDSFFRSIVRGDGRWRGPVSSGMGFAVQVTPEIDDLADLRIESMSGISTDVIFYPSEVSLPAGRIRGTIRDLETMTPLPGVDITAFLDDVLGLFTGFARSCPDGSYSMKVIEGSHVIAAFPNSFPDLVEGWYSPSTSPGDFCAIDAELVPVVAGSGSDAIDIDLDGRGGISGTVTVFGTPEPGALVSASLGNLGSCSASAFTSGSGNYAMELPAGSGYRAQALAPSAPGPAQCWDSEPDCATFTPIDVETLTTTGGIDFELGFPPPEISLNQQLTLLAIGKGLFELTFEQPFPEERADVFNIYEGMLSLFGTAGLADCFLDPGTFTNNGDGTLTHVFVPDPLSEWFLVSAGNPFAEGELGDGRSLSNSCGALPPPAASATAASATAARGTAARAEITPLPTHRSRRPWR